MAVMVLKAVYDGKEYEASVTQGDVIRYELEATRNNWPDIQQIPAMWSAFLAHRSLIRTGEIDSSLSFDSFIDRLEEISVVEQRDANPTQSDQSHD